MDLPRGDFERRGRRFGPFHRCPDPLTPLTNDNEGRILISVVVPVLNEEGNIASLLNEIIAVSNQAPIAEVIYVDDGSSDGTLEVLKSLSAHYPTLRIISHDRTAGQSAALWTGIAAARCELVVTLDGDGQNDPADIALLFGLYEDEKRQTPRVMIAGERATRRDVLMRRLASRFANGLRASLLQDATRDTGCALKLFRRQDYIDLPYFDHMHRFLPALMIRSQVRVVHVPVSHRPRAHGASKYDNLGRALVGISDLLGVWWLKKRANTFPKIWEFPG